MARLIKVSTTIKASPEKVWDNFMNPDNLKYWLNNFITAEPLKGAPGETGSISKLKFMEQGRETEFTESVILSNRPHQYSFRMEHPGFVLVNDVRLISFRNPAA